MRRLAVSLHLNEWQSLETAARDTRMSRRTLTRSLAYVGTRGRFTMPPRSRTLTLTASLSAQICALRCSLLLSNAQRLFWTRYRTLSLTFINCLAGMWSFLPPPCLVYSLPMD